MGGIKMVKGKVYKCVDCPDIVTIIDGEINEILCNGKAMQLLEEHTIDQEGREKHVPVIERDGDKVTVRVGSIEHPMEDAHYIELIQLYDGERILAEKFLYPNEKPEAVFFVGEVENLRAKEVCNIHGLWTS